MPRRVELRDHFGVVTAETEIAHLDGMLRLAAERHILRNPAMHIADKAKRDHWLAAFNPMHNLDRMSWLRLVPSRSASARSEA